MPLVTSRWYDIPLRAALVATLVAVVVTLSNIVGPRISGVIALFPAAYTSLMLILTPRIGGAATAALIANGQWGLIGFGLGVLTIHLADAAAWTRGRAQSRTRRVYRSGISGCTLTDTGKYLMPLVPAEAGPSPGQRTGCPLSRA